MKGQPRSDDFFEDEAMGKAFDARLMRRLLVYLRPHRTAVVLSVVALVFVAALHTLPNRLIGLAFDDFIQEKNLGGLKLYAGIMIVSVLVQFVLDYFRSLSMQRVGQNVMYVMRTQLFSHVQRMSLRFFDRNPVGRLMTRVGNDIETLNEFFSGLIANVCMDIFIIFAVIVWLFAMNARLAAITLAILPPAFILSFWFRKNARRCYRNTRMRLARVNAYFQENISGMRVVQIFNRQGKNQEKFGKLNDELKDEWHEMVFYYATFFPLMELITQISSAIVIVYGGLYLVGPKEIQPGELASFVLLTSMFFQPIRDLSSCYNSMQSAMASSERVFKILDSPPDIVPVEPVSRLETAIERIEFCDVHFSYIPGEEVLKGISFTVERGQSVAVVGATGAGKSTLVNLICRFYDVDSGRVLVNGIDVKHYDLQSLRSRMAVVLQDVFLFSGTVSENIRLGQDTISDEQVRDAARFVNAHRFVENLPDTYNAKVTERGTSLSTGQRQLLCFARAVAFRPDLLILDEATSSVDTETEHLIQEALGKLMANQTSLVIAHRLSTIQRADKIIVMHKGEVRETGTHQQLLRRPEGIYRKLYELQYQGQQTAG